EKLLTLILHGKTAVIAGVFVAGTTGMLVTGTIGGQNVDLTIQPATANAPASSPTTSSTNPVMAAIQQLLAGKPQEKGSSTSTGSDCSQAAHDRNAALKA